MKFAIDIIKLSEKLPNNRAINILLNQLIRSSTSVGANYRSACKGKSTNDFINKIVITEEKLTNVFIGFNFLNCQDCFKMGKLVF